MHHNRRLAEVPAHFCILRRLVGRDCRKRRDRIVHLRYPKLPERNIFTKHLLIGITLIPLQIPHSPHARHNPPHNRHQRRHIRRCSQSNPHIFKSICFAVFCFPIPKGICFSCLLPHYACAGKCDPVARSSALAVSASSSYPCASSQAERSFSSFCTSAVCIACPARSAITRP